MMGSMLVVFDDPGVEIDPQLGDRPVKLLAGTNRKVWVMNVDPTPWQKIPLNRREQS